jgi:hypothetical protein
MPGDFPAESRKEMQAHSPAESEGQLRDGFRAHSRRDLLSDLRADLDVLSQSEFRGLSANADANACVMDKPGRVSILKEE